MVYQEWYRDMRCAKLDVEIIINGNSTINPEDYTGTEALTKMYEYCKYYYDKINKNEK